MKRTKIFICGLVLLGLASVGRGEDPQNQQDNAQLRWRLERLESTIEELKKAAVAHAAPAIASNSAATATTSAADDEMKNLKQENAQLKQRLERLEIALASLGMAETKKPDSAPVEPNNPAGAAKPQPVGTPVVAKDPTPPVQPQAAIAMGEVKNCGPSAQAQPASSPAETRDSTPPVQAQAAGVTVEVKSPAPSAQTQPVSTPAEVKSATPPVQAQAAGVTVEVQNSTPSVQPQAAIAMGEVKNCGPSAQAQPASSPAETRDSTPPVQAQAASAPAEVKSPAPSAQTQPVSTPAEVKSATPPVQAQAAGVTVEVQNSTPSVQPQAAIAMGEVKNCGPSAQAQPASSPAETKDSTPLVQAQAASASAEVKSPAPSVQAQAASAPAEAKKPTDAPKPPAAAAPAASDKKNVLSSLDIEIYGIIKADASYDSSRTNPGNYVVYVDPEGTNKNDNEFNLTANHTRLGVRLGGPASDTLKTGGLIEFDFYGRTLASAPAENKAGILMRHAYLTLHWPKSQFSILAGQSWDIISPLNPNTLNYPVLWDAGNIGYRRPQIRLTQGVPLGEKTSMKFEGGFFRTIGRTDLTNSETGEDAGYPTTQGRVSVTFPFLGPKPTTVGVSGHMGQEEYDLNATGSSVKFEGWSLNLDVTLPVSSKLTVLGEGFCGRDLDQYFGGIGQGVNTTTRREIDAKGGWIAASLGPWSQWSYNVGAGIDRPDPDNLASGGRRQNSSIFGNVYYSFNKNVQFGVEISQWSTLYKGSSDADDTRVQTSFICKF